MLYKMAGYLGLDTTARKDLSSFADADSVSSWAEEAVSWAAAKGIISGTENGEILPQGTATRAAAAKMVTDLYAIFEG